MICFKVDFGGGFPAQIEPVKWKSGVYNLIAVVGVLGALNCSHV